MKRYADLTREDVLEIIERSPLIHFHKEYLIRTTYGDISGKAVDVDIRDVKVTELSPWRDSIFGRTEHVPQMIVNHFHSGGDVACKISPDGINLRTKQISIEETILLHRHRVYRSSKKKLAPWLVLNAQCAYKILSFPDEEV
jgi:hypothetical protein